MSDFHDEYPQYEMMAHHSEEEGVVKRKKLWKVFWIMLGITLVELFVGFQAEAWGLVGTGTLITFFIVLTVVKAFYIVFSFMHLGDEKPIVKWSIVAPFTFFIIYLACITTMGEGSYSLKHRHDMDKQIIIQQLQLKSGHGHHEATTSEEHKGTEQKHEENHHE